MGASKRDWLRYVTERDDDIQADAEHLAWRYHEEVELPEIAGERPSRAYATFQEMLDACEDENACTLCGSPLERGNALLCDACRDELIHQVEAREENEHVN